MYSSTRSSSRLLEHQDSSFYRPFPQGSGFGLLVIMEALLPCKQGDRVRFPDGPHRYASTQQRVRVHRLRDKLQSIRQVPRLGAA